MLLAVTSFSFAQRSPADRITPALRAELEKRTGADEQFRIIIGMAEKYDQAKLSKQVETMKSEQRREFVINELSRFSAATQADLLKTLNEGQKANIVKDVKSFWIFNGVSCITTREMIYALSERPDIAYIESDELRNMLPEASLEMKKQSFKVENPQTTQTNRDGAESIAWNVTQVHADQVWSQYNINGSGVIVAVIDTGLDYYHPDIISHLWQPTVNSITAGGTTYVLCDPENNINNTFTVGGTTYKYPGYDFAGADGNTPDNNPIDGNSHGTHCAGTVAGNGACGIQTGMAPGTTIMALKALSDGGSGSTQAILNAMQFAVAAGADAVSMSLGGHGLLGNSAISLSNTERDMMVSLMNSGVVALVAAGNEGEYYNNHHTQPNSTTGGASTTYYEVPFNIGNPGNCPAPWTNPAQTLYGTTEQGTNGAGHSAAITIGASNRNDRKSTFSSFGPCTWTAKTTLSANGYDDYEYKEGDATKIGLIKPDIIVPGSDITSMYYKYGNTAYSSDEDYNQKYMAECGTSMATPGAAGITALIIQAYKAKNDIKPTPAQIDEILETTAYPVDFRDTKNNTTGAGRADAKAAVDAIYTTATKPGTFQVTNVDANGIVQNGGCVHLSWLASTSADGGYAIWRDNEQVGTTTELTYTDKNPGAGKHTYYVRAIDDAGIQSVRSNAAFCTVQPYAFADNAYITWNDDATPKTATLGWVPTLSNADADGDLKYINVQDTYSAFTGRNFSTAYWGMCFNPEDLRPYQGMSIKSVKFAAYKTSLTGIVDDHLTLRIYRGTQYGNTTGAPVYSQDITLENPNSFTLYTIELTTPYELTDISEDLWITFSDFIASGYLGIAQEYPIAVGPYDSNSSNVLYMGSSHNHTTSNAAEDLCWSHIPDFGDDYNYALSFECHLERTTTYTDSYTIDYPDATQDVTISGISGNYTTTHTPTLASGENNYEITAKVSTGGTVVNTSCPEELKVVKVDSSTPSTVSNASNIDIDQTKVYLVQSDGAITSDGIICTDPTRLIVEDGGQVFTSSTNVQGTVKKNITAFGDGTGAAGGWQFIASPASTNLSASSVANLIADDNGETYGLYYYNEPTHYWVNYENGNNNIEPKKGYLYSNQAGSPIAFAGSLQPNNAEISVPLSYSETHPNSEPNVHPGWNLVGNPFPSKAYTNKSYYVTTYKSDSDSKTVLTKVEASSNTPIAPCTGIMVQATETNESVPFKKSSYNVELTSKGTVRIAVAHTVLSRGDVSETPADDAIVSFNAGDELEKFVFDADDARLYIPQNGKDYAIAVSELEGEVPVNFVAAENGSYTLNVKPENVEFTYLHLIDNKTGVDTDLLATPNYTFNASVTDYESRFRLLFSTDEANENADDDIFAFFNGSVWVIANDDDATLQVVDVMGRVLHSKDGARTLSTSDLATGVYTLRLVNGENVRTQKIVVR